MVDTSNEIAGDGDIPHPCIGAHIALPFAHAVTTVRACHDVAVVLAGEQMAIPQPCSPPTTALPRHTAGRARRMMVPDRSAQHDILLEAVQNHNPQVGFQ